MVMARSRGGSSGVGDPGDDTCGNGNDAETADSGHLGEENTIEGNINPGLSPLRSGGSSPHESAKERQIPHATIVDIPPPSPAASVGTPATAERAASGSADQRNDDDVVGANWNGGAGEGDGDGAVVVFQLLMQRWELRPWVVVPRTLVATKEQVRHTR